MKYDVVIMGAGVLGLSLAYHLSHQRVSSQLRILVLDRENSAGQHASGKNAGMFRQLYRQNQLREWAQRSQGEWPTELREKTFSQTGSLIVGRSVGEEDLSAVEREVFTEREFLFANGDKIPAVLTRTDGLLDSGTYVNFLQRAAAQAGSEFRFSSKVVKITREKGEWVVYTTQGERFNASWVVNATGAWCEELAVEPDFAGFQAQAFARHLFVVRGWSAVQKLSTRAQKVMAPMLDVGFFWDEHSQWYMRFWDADARLISICDRQATEVPEAFVPAEDIKTELSRKLLAVLPEELAQQLKVANSWHCFRTYTKDQLPLWGELSQFPRIFYLAAFGGFGMSTSFAAASDAAQYILGKSVDVATAVRVERFQGVSGQRNHESLGKGE